MPIASAPTGLMNETGLIENVLQWQPVSDADTYNLYKNAEVTPYKEGLTETTFVDLVELGSNDIYSVTAVNEEGESPKSYHCQAVANGNSPIHPRTLAIGTEKWYNNP